MIATFLYKNPRLLILAVGIIVTAGLSAIHVLPRMEDPVLSRRVGLVSTSLPGGNAERVESLVTDKLEERLGDIQEIKQIQSSTSTSHSVIVIELRDEVVEVEEVWSRVRDRLLDATSTLPEEATRPAFRELELKAYAAIVALKWNRNDPPNYAILRRLAENLKYDVRTIAGTESVNLFGDPGEEIVVEVEPGTLAALGLTPAEISAQIEARDAKGASGRVRSGSSELLLTVDEGVDSLELLGETPIQYGNEGRFVALSEIASISKGIVQPATRWAMVDAAPAVALAAFVRDDYRIDHWTARLRAAVAEQARWLPPGIESDVIFLQDDYVSSRLSNLLRNLVLGTAAVVVVIFFLMGPRSMIVVGAALPLSALMVLAGMRVMAIPIHQMSITGLIIALGLLIDNAIVIVDEVRSRLWAGLSPSHAIAEGVRHLAMPLFGSTLTTSLALAPIALLPGASGEFVRAIGITVILAISSSFVLAMTVVPALTALLQSDVADRKTFWHYGLSSRWLARQYEKSLMLVFRLPILGLAIGVMLPTIGLVKARTLPEQFFPATDRDQIQIEIELASSASPAETRRVAMAARRAVLADPKVSRVHWFVGQSAPTFFYNVMPRRIDAPFYAQALLELEPDCDARRVIHRLQGQLDWKVPECRALVRQLEQGPPFDAPIEVRLMGPDLAKLQELGSQVRLLLSQTPEVIHTRSDLEEMLPSVALDVDQAQTRLAGLSEREIARQLYVAVEGLTGGSLMEGTEEIPIRVRYSGASRSDLDQIGSMELRPPIRRGPTGTKGPPLAALARLNVASDVATIPRVDGQRMNEVKAYITAGVLPAQVVSEFERRLAAADFRLPVGYSMTYGGEAAKRNEAVRNLMADVAVLVVLMVATLVISFRSFRISMIIAAVGGLSIGLGLLALWSFGYPLGFMAILGTMGLVGVAINDAIVVMAGIREHPAARRGDPGGLREVVSARTRHVVATSLTTMAGFTPLVIGGGHFWPPLAISIAGGVAGATILALYFVPSLYLLLMGGGSRKPTAASAGALSATA